jgi:hypothetical protein
MQERQTPPIAIGAEGSLDRSQQGPLFLSDKTVKCPVATFSTASI